MNNEQERKEAREKDNLLELAWGLIANAHGGDWDLASDASGWKQAAEKWRDEYHALPDGSPCGTKVEG